jgi:small subunit ribosomal protein S8
MSVSDPIADMLTRVRNAVIARHADVNVPHSKMKEDVARVMHEEGYIESFRVIEEKPAMIISIRLKYAGTARNRRPVISGIDRVSRPGRRIYVKHDRIPWVFSGMGIAILTTPSGIMTGEKARRAKVGGEILCYVW